MLNKTNCFYLLGFYLVTITNLNAQDSTNIPAENPNQSDFVAAAVTTPPEASVTIHQDSRIKMLLDIKTKMSKDGEFSDRYKIQLYNGSLNKANEIMKSFNQLFPKWESSIKWETPEYKVWVGNYRTRIEADRALRDIQEEFSGAFIFKPEKNKS